jgi:hypothetical protein
MFEEVPRERRGFAVLTARRVALGPFVIGGGVLALTLGGSAAIAASVITVSTIGLNDLPPHRPGAHVVVATPKAAPKAERVIGSSTGSTVPGRPSGQRPGATSSPEAPKPRPTKNDPKSGPSQSAPVLSSTSPAGSGTPSTSHPTPSTSVTPSKPVGNALVFIFGYDTGSKRIKFAYAVTQPGAGPNGSDLYAVQDPHPYSAGIATDVQITSGGTICPPAGNTCTSQQLISAASSGGFFAEVAIDANGNLRVVVERDSPTAADAKLMPAPTVTPTASPAESATPVAGAAASAN